MNRVMFFKVSTLGYISARMSLSLVINTSHLSKNNLRPIYYTTRFKKVIH